MTRLIPLLALIATGCHPPSEAPNPPGRTEATRDTVVVLEPRGRTLVIDGFGGAVELTATDAPTARLTLTRRARGSSRLVAENLLETLEIGRAEDDEIIQLFLRAEQPEATAFDVRGAIPRGTPLHIRLDAGRIATEGFDAPATLHVDDGPVAVREASGRVEASTGRGAISASWRALPPPDSLGLSLRAGEGSVSIALPDVGEGRAVSIEAEVERGRVVNQGVPLARQRLSPRGMGARLDALVGDPTATPVRLRMRAGSGTISLFATSPRTL